ncbi:hypothetical protein A3D00_03710 [Candidatus Woesebacteria bacterium RIFCSPHIGHO2_02_FULL_38_9]|uniref:Diacylglycerol kinase n=1 Tax=Candidatus Woesebacteria bacterium RIFCSPHIGHO2_01_FULL_39_28 TaxID=1802496 RepID=A0A1F7YHE1_9BACT|nr:MAG: hypothetical protein A2627_01030 [Candidatus Woesebacteria bacterium RIFCSPHIGHO2_01_FULL_39_28]OGM32597.1 MAG: hypothetical protein A3D00_03710 [Candidatus Woesebacteria bacterium RIFCSPHIGHO2_02_FULL_38_9]OGM57711.1 MAG: hypothetical protein A3A50_01740 [Candidatus Woesebacteria bacterium RIFCSPLOWO2_01_FULL_38_20]
MAQVGKHTVKSFRFAFEGLKAVFEGEPNFRVHILITFLVLTLAWVLGFSPLEFTILLITIGLVLILELVNTAIEETINLISTEFSPRIKLIKDVAAAGVLLSAILSVIIGVLLFLPKILQVLNKI